MNAKIRLGKILIVDDDFETAVLIEGMLRRAGYRAIHTVDSREALARAADAHPDLLILDLAMPPDGFEFLDRFMGSPQMDGGIGVLVITADGRSETRMKALATGAQDFLTKPLDEFDLLMRTQNLLRLRLLQRELAEEKARRRAVEKQVRAAESEDTLDRLVKIAAFLDSGRSHTATEVARLSVQIGESMGLDTAFLELFASAARLFDFGMLGVPETIRRSKQILAPEDVEMMKRHTLCAGELLGGSNCAAMKMAREIGQLHHERWDGAGYPFGLKSHDIPLAARIVAVAHVYHALLTAKAYRRALAPHEAWKEVSRQAGFAFDPQVVAGLERVVIDGSAGLAAEGEVRERA